MQGMKEVTCIFTVVTAGHLDPVYYMELLHILLYNYYRVKGKMCTWSNGQWLKYSQCSQTVKSFLGCGQAEKMMVKISISCPWLGWPWTTNHTLDIVGMMTSM